jgi:diguanylate cyclase (GGDEF)-like protein
VPEAPVLIYAPGQRNAELIVGRLNRAGVGALVAEDAAEFADLLERADDGVGAVVVTAAGMRYGAADAIERYQEEESLWSALPIVLLTPATEAPLVPWRNATVVTQPTTARVLVAIVRRALEARAQQYRVARVNVRLERIAFRDALTGLPNRTALYERIRELQRERRGHEGSFSALFLDVDDFKRINDRYGHAAGDAALQQVASHVATAVRSSDFVARWGGDEFIVLLLGAETTGYQDATLARLAESVRVHLEHVADEIVVSLSVGLLDEISPDQSPDEILSIADSRMYAHKHAKRRTPG